MPEQPLQPQPPSIADIPGVQAIPQPSINKTADAIGIIGFGTMVCEVVKDPKAKGDCRELLAPLEEGKKDPIEVLVDLLVHNPDEIDEATDRFNYNMQEAMKIAEEKIRALNAA